MITEKNITDLAMSTAEDMQELLRMLRLLNYMKKRNESKKYNKVSKDDQG